MGPLPGTGKPGGRRGEVRPGPAALLGGALLLAAACGPAPPAEDAPAEAWLEYLDPGADAAALSENQPEAFYAVLARVAEGRESWLDVAARLGRSVEAHSGEELTDALALALARNPAGVLRRSFGRIEPAAICGGPYNLEPEAARAAAEQMREGVRALSAPDLAAARAACLAVLDQDPGPGRAARSAR